MKSKHNISNILVDFDGTLNDTHSVFISKLDGLLMMDGEFLYFEYMDRIHRGIVHREYPEKHDDVEFHWSLFLACHDISYDPQRIDILTARFKEAEVEVLEKPKLFPEVEQFLNCVSNLNLHLCLSTGGNNSSRKIKILSEILGKNYFNDAFDEGLIGHLKHKPSFYRSAIDMLNWSARETISIGDTILTDIHPAKVIGIKTLWINRRNIKSPEAQRIIPDFETTDLISALDLFLDKQRTDACIG